MIFEDELIKKGEAGGEEAASLLWNAIYTQVQASSLPSDIKVVARVYADLKGLGEICSNIGIIPSRDLIRDFACGFTGSKPLFDFIDVVMGEDRADDKISGTHLMLSRNQPHTHKIQES